MPPAEDLQKGEYDLKGGIVMLDASNAPATQNLHQGTSVDTQPMPFKMTLKGMPVLTTGVLTTSQYNNTVTAINSITDSAGLHRLAVSGIPDPIATPSAPAAASVGVASGAVMNSNANRRHAVFVNTSASTISLGFGQAAVLNSGVTLMANGGAYEMSQALGNLYKGEIRAIAAGAASNLAMQEDS